MNSTNDPRELPLKNETLRLKFNQVGLWTGILRLVFDLSFGKLGQSTIPEFFKAIGLQKSKETQAFQLIATALVGACRKQLQERVSKVRAGEHTTLVYDMHEFEVNVFEGLAKNEYTFHRNDLGQAYNLDLLEDFLNYYEGWLQDAFKLEEDVAKAFARAFPDHFAAVFLQEIIRNEGDQYSDLLEWCENPNVTRQYQLARRQQYRTTISEYYHRPALGQAEIALSDIYVELNFKLFKQHQSIEAQERQLAAQRQDLFTETKYAGSIHDYFLNHFMTGQPAPDLPKSFAEKRLLLLFGQPGHGKSSFCYRCIHDLLKTGDAFLGEVLFVKLNRATKMMLDTPLEYIKNSQEAATYALDWDVLLDNDAPKPVVLFLDGLDEMCMAQGLSDAKITAFISTCARLTEQHHALRIVITSRHNYVPTTSLSTREALICALSDLSLDNQAEMVATYKRKKNIKRCNLDAIMKQLKENKRTKTAITELLQLPILLQMILVSKVQLDEQSSKATIYKKLFDYVLNRRWDKAGRLHKWREEPNFKPQHLRNYLAFLAYQLFKSKEEYLHGTEVEDYDETKKFTEKYLSGLYEGAQTKDVLKDVLTNFYLKETQANEESAATQRSKMYAFEFLHKSLYEYLACEHIWTKLTKFFLKDDFDDYTTEDVLKNMQKLFAHFRFTKETATYMLEIVNHPDNIKHHDLLQKRMAKWLPKLTKHGFLQQYIMPTKGFPQYTAEQQALQTFYGYWLILSNLNQVKVNVAPYFELEWEEFVEKYLDEGAKARLQKSYAEELEQQKLEWLTQTPYVARFSAWLRRQIIIEQEQTKALFQEVVQAQSPIAKELVNLLRKVIADRLPAQYKWEHLDWTKADLQGILAAFNKFRLTSLRSADLRSADLRSADLRSADLRYADLSSAYLRSADLRSADLSSANLIYADLSSADLRSADLSSANLIYADLSYADLSSADLRSAYLRYADLSSAYLSYAYLSSADLSYADLSSAKLEGAIVERGDWLEELAQQEVRGLDWVNENFEIEAEAKEHRNWRGIKIKGYRIRRKSPEK